MHGLWAASYIVLWVLVVVLVVTVVSLSRQVAELGRTRSDSAGSDGPHVGDRVPAFKASDVDGHEVAIGGGDARAQLLVFVSPSCAGCEVVLAGIDTLTDGGGLDAVIVTDVDDEESRLTYGGSNLAAPVVAGAELFHALAIPTTPYLVVLGSGGAVRGKGTATSFEQAQDIVAAARSSLG